MGTAVVERVPCGNNFCQSPISYNVAMKRKTLSEANPHLRDAEKAARQRIRSVASSTAIETGEPVRDIEKKIRRLESLKPRVSLA